MRITLKHVAVKAGVSYQTVSKVLNGQIKVTRETEERIHRAAKELGYKPNYTARSLRSRRSNTIGYCWTPAPFNHTNPVLDHFLQAMLLSAKQRGYYILCFPYYSDLDRLIESYNELIDTSRVDGFILSNVEYNDARIHCLLERDFPFAAFGQTHTGEVYPHIDVDNTAGMCISVQHLLDQGHRKIAILAWPEDSRVGNDRMAGYLKTMKAAGITPLPEWICRGVGETGFGQSATQKLMALPEDIRPTAIAAVNDYMALGAMNAIFEVGLRVGEDIAVVGYDDSPLVQHLHPPLSSIRQPIAQIGQMLIDMLLEVIQGKPFSPEGVLVPPQLIVRASSNLRRS